MGQGDLAPEDGHLPVGTGIHHAANALDGLTDLTSGGPVLGALEWKVFDKMGDSSQFVGLVA